MCPHDDTPAEPGSADGLHDCPPDSPQEGGGARLSRRAFLQSSSLLAGGLVSGGIASHAAQVVAQETSSPAAANASAGMRTVLRINGRDHEFVLEPRTTLLDVLREHAGLTGTKKGCDRGQCGACTVLVNERRINSCLALAVMHQGDDIVTIEGLGTPEALHPMQAAFIEHDGFQCGYCTPGQICSAVSLLNEAKRHEASAVTPDVRALRVEFTDEEIRERMSGNICRCGAYPNIVKAVRSVAQKA